MAAIERSTNPRVDKPEGVARDLLSKMVGSHDDRLEDYGLSIEEVVENPAETFDVKVLAALDEPADIVNARGRTGLRPRPSNRLRLCPP